MTLIQRLELIVRAYSTVHFAGNKKDILLLSSPRSGSTWLMEIIAATHGMKPIREPMNLRKPEVPDMLGWSRWEDSYKHGNEDRIIQYLRRFDKNAYYDYRFKREKPITPTWHPITDRIIYKVLHGCEHMVARLQQELDLQVVFLIRHPVPVALSREAAPRTSTFLNSDYSDYLSTDEIRQGRHILDNGNELQKAALDWCLQNVVPLRQLRPDWTLVTYEQLVLEPELVLAVLANRLNLSEVGPMFDMIYRASGSSAKSSAESRAIISDPKQLMEQRQWLLTKWHNKITAQEKEDVFELLDFFGIDVYTRGSEPFNMKYRISKGE